MKRSLDKYAQKRTFTKTPEPAPAVPAGRRGPLLFIVQKHAARRLHYDFRLELDGVLKSWAVPKGPSLQIGEKRLAVAVEDHPFDYASFEGVIPEQQYGAGNVIVWDCGVYSPDEGQQYSFDDRLAAEERVRNELQLGKLSFFLRGIKLKGSFALIRTSTDKQWLLIKHKDRFVGGDDLLAHNTSVLTGDTLDDVDASSNRHRLAAVELAPVGPEEPLPQKLLPMLAEPGEELRSDAAWSYEPKLDGYRIIAFVAGDSIYLQSRRGQDYTAMFPELVADLKAQCVGSMVLDGEIVALDADGRPSFNALQNRAQLKTAKDFAEAQRQTPVIFICFDLLHFAGLNLRAATYEQRRRYLSQCLLPTGHLQLIHVSDNAEQLHEASLAAGFEGTLAKRKDSPYQPGRRSSNWLKYKSVTTVEFVVGGFTKGKGHRTTLGALLLGYWKKDELIYVGHVGSGFNDETLAQVRRQVTGLAARTCPFSAKPPLNGLATWIKPTLVAEVSFDSWTEDGHLRAPVFVRLRDDVAPDSVSSGPAKKKKVHAKATPKNEIESVREQLDSTAIRLDLSVGQAKIRLTNLDREYWPAVGKTPAITKRDYLRYLAGISRYMLPHLRDRPLTLARMPGGIGGERFFQKHWDQERPDFVETVTVFSEHVGGGHDYILAHNLPTLLWLGQGGTLEFHVWHSRAKVGPDGPDNMGKKPDYAASLEAMEASVLNYPDYLVFDIDPYIYSGKEPKGAEPELNKKGFAMGKRVAFWINDLLKEMSLQAVVKTSGKTGLHVFVPIQRTVTFEGARHICEMVGRHVLKEHPRDVTMEWATHKRTGKIFIDHNMNVRGKTLNVAYSPRGVPGAPVSMPLTWDELEAAEPGHFTLHNVLARVAKTGDRWHDVLSMKQSLAKAFGSKVQK